MTDDVKSMAHSKQKFNSKPTAKPKAKSSAGLAKLKKKVEALEVEKNELNDRFLRKAAEFDNYPVISPEMRLAADYIPTFRSNRPAFL